MGEENEPLAFEVFWEIDRALGGFRLERWGLLTNQR